MEENLAASTVGAKKLADKFNQTFGIGTPIRYWSGVRRGPGRTSVTRSHACVLSSDLAVVFVDGHPGAIALSHVEPLPPASTDPEPTQEPAAPEEPQASREPARPTESQGPAPQADREPSSAKRARSRKKRERP